MACSFSATPSFEVHDVQKNKAGKVPHHGVMVSAISPSATR